METIHKLAIVVVALFTLALGFGILRGNMKMMEESIVKPTTTPIDSINWSDTVSYYDNRYAFDTLGYRVNVNITYMEASLLSSYQCPNTLASIWISP